MSKGNIVSLDSSILENEMVKFLIGTDRLVATAFSVGISGTLQHTARQSPDPQQAAVEEIGGIGIESQPPFAINDAEVSAPGIESSIIVAVMNATNKTLLMFIS